MREPSPIERTARRPNRAMTPTWTPPTCSRGRRRTNRWCPTIRQGIALWAIIAVGWAVIPADHPMQIAVAISGVYASLLLPTALYFDYRERRAESSAEGRVRETAGALADRVRDALPGRGSSTRASSSCSCNR
ncbi:MULTISPECIES: hypothetical protein [unclassified Haloferax]|uniref:hypothetical protein n=1 Tax=unclassified Haloferax TaxID=2625095 RepID=UPI001F360221|nr:MULTISPECIES: hypothetical protein [unclassified Haloferax]